jgi:predicted PurR-regulated permease PerM
MARIPACESKIRSMLWGMILGIIGMVLATPVTATVKILSERLERTRPIA